MKRYTAVVKTTVDMDVNGISVSADVKYPIEVLAVPVVNRLDYETYYHVIFPTPSNRLCTEMYEYQGSLKNFVVDMLLTIYDEVLSLEEIE